MPKKTKGGQTRHDKWWKLAKEQGYRSRAAFKLIQLNKKYDFLGKSRAVMDLCAAPGGWLQVAAKYCPPQSLVVGVDLLPIKAIPGCTTSVNDITTQKCRTWLKREAAGWDFDVVMCDGAPNVGGSTWAADAFVQNELCVHALKLATEFLRPGGIFITKVFRSADYNALLWLTKQFFEKVDVTKPVSSRNTSAEIYFVGIGFLKLKKVDPRLFDITQIFKKVDGLEDKPKPNVMNTKVKLGKRNRGGYEDDVTLLYKEVSLDQFVEHNEPAVLLGEIHRVRMDKDSPYYSHASTTDEIKTLCEDLKVLGKGDFAALLKWRQELVAYRNELTKAAAGPEEEEEKAEEAEEVPELSPEEQAEAAEKALMKELKMLQEKARHASKAEKKKIRDKRKKLKQRLALSGVGQSSEIVDTPTDQGLFSLNQIKNKTVLKEVEEAAADNLAPPESSDDDMHKQSESEESDSDSDLSDSEKRTRQLSKELDDAYKQYKARRKIVTREHKLQLKKVGLENEEDEDKTLEALARKVMGQEKPDSDPEDSEDFEGPLTNKRGRHGSKDDEDDDDENPLLRSFGVAKGASTAARVERWFDRDLLAGLDADAEVDAVDEGDEADEEDIEQEGVDVEEKKSVARAKAATKTETKARTKAQQKNDDAKHVAATKSAATGNKPVNFAERESATSASDSDSDGRGKGKDTFEEVPMEEDFSDDSDARAETMALGQLMIRKDKRQHLIDSSFNRYAFPDDKADLPKWFVDDEDQHNKAQLPVTKDAVQAFKEQLKAINARPIKKIAEATGRKRMKAAQRLEKARASANEIANNASLSAVEKAAQIQKLYTKANKKKEHKERTYVVGRRTGGLKQAEARKGVSGPVKMVDRRLKADTKGLKRAEKRKAKPRSVSRSQSKGGKSRTRHKRRK